MKDSDSEAYKKYIDNNPIGANNVTYISDLSLCVSSIAENMFKAGRTSVREVLDQIAEDVCAFYSCNPRLSETDVEFLVKLEERIRECK